MAAPLRFALYEPYRLAQLGRAGTIVVKTASAWGFEAWFATRSPCCRRQARIDAALWAGTGAPYTCPDCGWKWTVFLALGGQRLPQLPRDARHPHIDADRAEWVSDGVGKRQHRRRAS